MRSTFHLLEVSKRGLFAQQNALNVTGHNIANANTEGYTRQRANMQATRGIPVPGMNNDRAPGQLGIGVYSPRLDEHGNSVRGVETCEHLSRDLGLHMFNVTRESRVTIRSVYDLTDTPVSSEWSERERSYLRTCRDRIRVYELQGDLTFAGAESVHRRLVADMDDFTVVIVEISRLGVIDAVARTMVLSIKRLLADSGRRAALVDPDGVVRASVERQREEWLTPNPDAPVDLKGFDPTLPHVHTTMEDAVIDAETFMLKHYYDQ